MNVIIMCGGKGTRLREETVIKPKPMVEIGGRPVLWHIMSIYARFGHKDFILPLGYKGEYIKQYFHDYYIRNTDFTVDLKSGAVTPTAACAKTGASPCAIRGRKPRRAAA